VERIEVLGSPAIAGDFMVYEPVDTVDAQFSLPYAMAMVLLGYEPGYDWLAPERIGEPEMLHEAKKVTASVDRPAVMQSKADWPVTVKVLATMGRHFKTDIRIPRGHPERSLSTEEHFTKFRRLAIPVIGEAPSEELISRVMNLENENTLSWISDLSTPI
jgi:2-methylcitrate dehydratase PrpD